MKKSVLLFDASANPKFACGSLRPQKIALSIWKRGLIIRQMATVVKMEE